MKIPNFYRIKLGEELSCETGIYLKRWFIETPFFSIRFHHWLSSDDSRNQHDHPWWFITLILLGGYTDVSPTKEDNVGVGSIRFRPANHKHYVKVNPTGCWTFLLTGGRSRRWGFWIKDRFMKANKYFLTFGSHPCDR